MSATYLVWHPRVSSAANGHEIKFNITVASANPALAPTAATCREIMTELEWGVADGDWTITPYRSNYHGERADSWKREWPRGWRAVLTSKAQPPPPPLGEYFESYAMGEPAANAVIQGLVIADFSSASAAESLVEKLVKSRNINKAAKSESFPLFGEVVQLQIAIASAEESQFESILPALKEAVALCRSSGGITSFDERAEKWGEAE